jgi:hypothetical protein
MRVRYKNVNVQQYKQATQTTGAPPRQSWHYANVRCSHKLSISLVLTSELIFYRVFQDNGCTDKNHVCPSCNIPDRKKYAEHK